MKKLALCLALLFALAACGGGGKEDMLALAGDIANAQNEQEEAYAVERFNDYCRLKHLGYGVKVYGKSGKMLDLGGRDGSVPDDWHLVEISFGPREKPFTVLWRPRNKENVFFLFRE